MSIWAIFTLILLILYAAATVADTLLSIHGIIKHHYATEANRFMRPLFESENYVAIWLVDAGGILLIVGVAWGFLWYGVPVGAIAMGLVGLLPRLRVVLANYRLYRDWKELNA